MSYFAVPKIIFFLFALFAWSRAFLRFRAKKINIKELIFWTLIWTVVTIAVFTPGKTALLAKLLGMGRGFDAMTFIAVVTLFYVVYRLYVKANESEQVITELTREIALRKVIKSKRKR